MLDAIARMAFTEDARTGSVLLWSDTLASLTRMALGIAVAALAGLGLGIASGAFPMLRATLSPLMAVLSMIPPLAILPILFIVFGLDELSKVMLIVIGITPVLARDLEQRAREIPAELLVKAQTLGANSWTAVLRVILPQLLARLLLSLRLMLGAAWLFLISSEAISATAGLGYRIFLVRRYMSMDVILPYVAWITLLAWAMDWALRLIHRKCFPGPRGARHEFHRDSQRLAALWRPGRARTAEPAYRRRRVLHAGGRLGLRQVHLSAAAARPGAAQQGRTAARGPAVARRTRCPARRGVPALLGLSSFERAGQRGRGAGIAGRAAARPPAGPAQARRARGRSGNAPPGRFGHALARYPNQLSGGMQQRLAIAQALITRPRMLLLDEPFGALDPGIRKDMHALLLELWREARLTVFMVTHDLSEGFHLGTRLLVFDKVRIDPQAPQAYGARITYDIPLNPDRAAGAKAVASLPPHVVARALPPTHTSTPRNIMNTDSLFIEAPLYEETLPGGGHASFILKRGQVLRITDLEGGANVGMMLLNARQPSERLNLPDTLKGQHTFRLTEGHCLYSDMGRVLAAIVSDSCGWHDSIGGVLDAGEVQAKYGSGRYQELRNGFFRNGHDNLLVEMGKWNLDLEDLLMVVNLFSKVTADEHGILRYVSGNSQAGDHVALYAPMDTLVVLTALQHPMDPNPRYAPRPIRMTWSQARTASIADACRASRPENARAFHNTERLYL